MTLYVDSSALLKRYIDERDSDVAVAAMAAEPVLVTSGLTEVEVRRNLARLLEGSAYNKMRRQLLEDLDAFALVSLDAVALSEAARIAEKTVSRSLDSIHLAAARRAGPSTTLLTFDLRQAGAARQLGMAVIGV